MKFHLIPGTFCPRWGYSYFRNDLRSSFGNEIQINSVKGYSHLVTPTINKRFSPERVVEDVVSRVQADKSGEINVIIGHSFGGNIGVEAVKELDPEGENSNLLLFTMGTRHKLNYENGFLFTRKRLERFVSSEDMPPSLKKTFSATGDRVVNPELSKLEEVDHQEVEGGHFSFLFNEKVRQIVIKSIQEEVIS